MKYLFVAFFSFAVGNAPLLAEPAPDVKVQIVAEVSQAKPGETILIGVHFLIEEGWHIYWKVSGDAGFPTTVDWTVPRGFQISELKWPAPEIFREGGTIRTAGYKEETVLLASVKIPSDWPAGKPIVIGAKVKWLVCKVSCIPGGAKISKRLTTGQASLPEKAGRELLSAYARRVPSTEEEQKIAASLKQDARSAGLPFGTALLFAFLGGLVLNVMPCVLPVLAIKVFRLTKHQERPRTAVMGESLAYMAGVLFSFALLGGLVIVIKGLGQEIGWGFQFQEPRFIVALTAILFLSALSFMGYFEFSFFVPASLTHHLQKGGLAGALWDGFLATLLATPCTAPLLGPALGFSFSQPPAIILLFFMVIGLGLALPYFLFATIPHSAALLPKPGAWMETFKELMGFPLLGTAVWLAWILGQQQGNAAVIGLLIFLLVLAFALWGSRHSSKPLPKILFILLVAAVYFLVVEPSLKGAAPAAREAQGDRWRTFSSASLEEALAQKKSVFVDFTADWCLTCQLNKRVLHSKSVTSAFERAGVVTMRADWTNRRDEITQTLRELGRSGVPVYAFYPNGESKAALLPELLTEKAVLDALKPYLSGK